MLFKPFIAFSAVPRYVTTFQARAEDPRFPAERIPIWVSASDLNQRYSGGGSRSASADSRKRSRSQISGDGNDEEDDGWYTRNVRSRRWSNESEAQEAEEAHWYAVNVLGRASEDEEDDWYERNVAGEQSDEERGRPRTRPQRREKRSEHTVDTLPSLTDTSAAGDPEDLNYSGFLAPTSTSDPFDNHAFKGVALVESVLDRDVASVKDAT